MAEYTLDNAKKRRGEWLPIDDGLEACLEWSTKEGWILTFRDPQTLEIGSTLEFHKRQGIQGVSWPGAWSLRKLSQLSGKWSDRVQKPPLLSWGPRRGPYSHAGVPF